MEDDKIERLRERILQCPICMDEFKDPRMLPCHHSVCLTCLLDYVRHSSTSGRVFRCPQCRMDICVPRGGVKDFPPNFYINCIQDEIGSKPYFGICDICERDWLVSQYRCITCDLDICKFCIHEHKLFKHDDSRDGEIIKIETGNIGPTLVSQKSCESHEGEPLQMFCLNCDCPCCVTCVCESHKKHDTIPLSKKLSLARKHLQFELDSIKDDVKSIIENQTKLEDIKQIVQSAKDNCVKSIRNRARDLSIEIDKIAEAKIQEVCKASDCGLQEMDGYIREMASLVGHLRRGNKFLEDLEEGDMSLELLSNFQKFQQKTDTMKKAVTHRKICYQKTNFEHNSMGSFFNIIHYFCFGTVTKEKVCVTMMPKKAKKKFLGPFSCINVINIRILLLLIGVFFVVSSLIFLSFNLYNKMFVLEDSLEDDHTGDIAGLCFFSYLSLSALFAYLKS